MNQITIFQNPDFGQIRITRDAQGEPLFCLPDVCKILELRAPDVKRRLDDAVVSTHTVKDSLGRKNLMTFVNEDGLYDAILDSRKPEARAFRKWVTSVVLPQIRQTGGYLPVAPEDDDASIMAKALLVAQRTLEAKDEIIGRLAPRAQYSDEVLCSVSCLTVTQIAKELGMSGHALNKLLCQKGVQYAQSGQYLLYAEYARRGLAQNRTHKYTNADGQTVTRTYLVWTEAGRDFIHRLVG